MPGVKIESLCDLILQSLDAAKDQFSRIGDYVIEYCDDEPKNVCFYDTGVEVLACSAAKFCFPEEVVDASTFRVNGILLYSPQYCTEINTDFSPYQGEFFRGVRFSDSREEVRHRLGAPVYLLDSARYDEYPISDRHSFQVYYKRGFGCVSYGAIVTSRSVRRKMGIIK